MSIDMKASSLAAKAIEVTQRYEDTLTPALLKMVAEAYITRWFYAQSVAIDAEVIREIVRLAVAGVHEHFKDAPQSQPEAPTSPSKAPARVEVPEGVKEATWADFLLVRKAKKAPVTATAIVRLRHEAEQAGWTLEAAIQECVARGWVGFNHAWVAAPIVKADIVRVTTPASTERDPALVKIDEDRREARKPNPEALAALRALAQRMSA
jgi:hypothetical protein